MLPTASGSLVVKTEQRREVFRFEGNLQHFFGPFKDFLGSVRALLAQRLFLDRSSTCQEINHKRVYRLYREEGLAVRKRRRKRVSRADKVRLAAPTGLNQLWTLDFMGDALSWGRKIRLLTAADAFTRERPWPSRWTHRSPACV